MALRAPSDPPTAALASEHRVIFDLIEPGSRVLDLGCGRGELLAALSEHKGVRAEGIEIAMDCLMACVAKGVSNIHQADLDQGLADYADGSMDYVVLTGTIQVLQRPSALVREMARVGRKLIVGFPNFAHWRCRLQLLRGRMPKTSRLPYEWYDTPNIHLTTIEDFRELCRAVSLTVEKEIPLLTGRHGSGPAPLWPNLLADYAVFVVGGRTQP